MAGGFIDLGLDLTDVAPRDAGAQVAGDAFLPTREVIDIGEGEIVEVELSEHTRQVLQEARLLFLRQCRKVFGEELHLAGLRIDRRAEDALQKGIFLAQLSGTTFVEIECLAVVALREVGGVEGIRLGIVRRGRPQCRLDLGLSEGAKAKGLHTTAQRLKDGRLVHRDHEDDGALGGLFDELEELVAQRLLHALGQPDDEDAVATPRGLIAHHALQGLAFASEDRGLLPIATEESQPFIVIGIGALLYEAAPVLDMVFAEVLPRSVDDGIEEGEVRIPHFVIATAGGAMPAGVPFSAVSAVEVAGIGVSQAQCALAITPREELGVRDEPLTSRREELRLEAIVTDNISEVHRLRDVDGWEGLSAPSTDGSGEG